jgi:hypothetical protein
MTPAYPRRKPVIFLPVVELVLAAACGIQPSVKYQASSSRAVFRENRVQLSLLLAFAFCLAATADPLDTTKGTLSLRAGLEPDQRLTAHLATTNLSLALSMYAELTGRKQLPATNSLSRMLDEMSGGRLSRWQILNPGPLPDSGLTFHGDGFYSAAEVKSQLENLFRTNGLAIVPSGKHGFRAIRVLDMGVTNGDQALAVERFLARSHDRRFKLYTLLLLFGVLFGTPVLYLIRRIYDPTSRSSTKRPSAAAPE